MTTSVTHLQPVFVLEGQSEYTGFNSILSLLSYLLKAPMVPHSTPVVNALFRQRACIENIFRACIGLQPQNHMLLEHKLPRQSTSAVAVEHPVEHPVVKEERGAPLTRAKVTPMEISES